MATEMPPPGLWDEAEMRCPGCGQLLRLRWEATEVWCAWCEEGFDVKEAPHPSRPGRTVLTLAPKLPEPR